MSYDATRIRVGRTHYYRIAAPEVWATRFGPILCRALEVVS